MKKGNMIMGKPDQLTKALFSNKTKFADLFNGIFFQGKQKIRPEDLSEMKTEQILVVGENSKEQASITRYRDCLMMWKDSVSLLLLGIENQDKIHYATPLRNLTYDIMCYVNQTKQIQKQHKDKKDYISSHEFLSGFYKNDTLKPVVTIVVYWGEDEWDAKLEFQDMLEYPDEEVKEAFQSIVPQYRAILVEPNKMDRFDVFQTSIRDIFTMMKYRSQTEEFKQYVTNNHRLLDKEDMDLLQYILKDDSFTFHKVEDEEAVEVCIATRAIYNDGVNDGIQKGIQKGRQEERKDLLQKLQMLGVDGELLKKLETEFIKEVAKQREDV